jgi:hypothetical protein
MILTAHQPVYIPWLGLFHKIALADEFVSFNQVQYQPKDWNNRNKIKTAQGPKWLTVPVLRKGYLEKTISEIQIDDSRPWRKKHLRTLEINYSKSKFFDRYYSYLEEVYFLDWTYLVDFNEHLLKWFIGILGLKPIFHSAANYKFAGQKSDLVLNMCKQVDADKYVFGAEGKNYVNEKSFQEVDVQIMIQEYRHPSYSQLHGPFISHLSILDLLFNCGDLSLDILMSGNLNKFVSV